MTSAIEQRLAARGLELPEAPAPAANYIPYTISGKLVFVAVSCHFATARWRSAVASAQG